MRLASCASETPDPTSYVSNTQSEEKNTVFYSHLACFVITLTLNMYVSMSYYRVQQAEYSMRILVAAPQEHVNTYSTCRPGRLTPSPAAVSPQGWIDAIPYIKTKYSYLVSAYTYVYLRIYIYIYIYTSMCV